MAFSAISLVPLPVAAPLAVAGLLLVFSKALPRKSPDVVAIMTALAVATICAVMTARAAGGPLVYWFGGWTPRNGQVIGIAFAVDQAGGAMATVIGTLFFATLVFAWGYFDEVHAHFHVLMLLFMAGMIGFCLTHDVFNMFVWFEVMSVAAFALTGYELRAAPLEGALNFTVVNTIGSYLLLAGIGLLYAFGGALDMTALGKAVARAPSSPVVNAAFLLLGSGLLIKAAQVPFHFWLPDAHSVAPSPVSVIFSGAMVALGIFGLARVTFTVFSASTAIAGVVHTLLLGMGVASAVLGAAMALLQRHLKRLLAFSTVSHTGVLLIGLALLSREGTSGMLLYMVGHGLVKAALFMVVGILLAACGGIDEIGLRGRGAEVWPAGVAMAIGGLLLGGLPIGLMDDGVTAIHSAASAAGQGWLTAALVVCAAGTGAAVLRAAGRIFLGLGPVPGEEGRSPTEDEQEKADRPLWLMLAPTAALLLATMAGADAAGALAWRGAGSFMQLDPAGLLGTSPLAPSTGNAPDPATSSSLSGWLSVGLALLVAGYDLMRQRLPPALVTGVGWVTGPICAGLRHLHSGAIGDYVAWLVVGMALFTVAFGFG